MHGGLSAAEFHNASHSGHRAEKGRERKGAEVSSLSEEVELACALSHRTGQFLSRSLLPWHSQLLLSIREY